MFGGPAGGTPRVAVGGHGVRSVVGPRWVQAARSVVPGRLSYLVQTVRIDQPFDGVRQVYSR